MCLLMMNHTFQCQVQVNACNCWHSLPPGDTTRDAIGVGELRAHDCNFDAGHRMGRIALIPVPFTGPEASHAGAQCERLQPLISITGDRFGTFC
jgi:hypothetical protein